MPTQTLTELLSFLEGLPTDTTDVCSAEVGEQIFEELVDEEGDHCNRADMLGEGRAQAACALVVPPIVELACQSSEC